MEALRKSSAPLVVYRLKTLGLAEIFDPDAT